jgi:CRISPR-associated protein Csx10
MKARLIVLSESPLNFRVSRSTANFDTLKYIPGTALLGAFAAAHLKTRDDETEFTQFFLSGEICFGNLYPANFQSDEFSNTDLRDDEQPVKPIPNTARSCKRFRGFRFKADSNNQERHGVMDSLVYWGLFALSSQLKIEILNAHKICPYPVGQNECGELLDAFPGFYRRGEEITEIGKSEAKTRLLTRTGISRETGTVQEGILYNREVLNEGQSFWGTMSFADESLYNNFCAFARDVGYKGMLRIGNNLTRGLGKLGVLELEEFDTDDLISFKQRTSAFNQKFHTEAQAHCVDLPHQFYFPITLQSDAILPDPQLRYQTALDGNYLHHVGHLSDVTLVYQNASQRRVIGWNALFGLPKAAEWAISMGSVFFFGYDGIIADSFYKQLYALEQTGIGKRRLEGFGQVTVADAFHWEVNEYESTDENS